MNVRLVILVLLAGGLAVYFAVGKNREPVNVEPLETGVDPEDEDRIRAEQDTLDQRDLPGEEPSEEPELAVTVEVDRSKGKNRLYFNLSEKHGYYVETFRVAAWYKEPGLTDYEDAKCQVRLYVNDYIKANETLRICAEAVPAELARVGGDMGTTENWDAEITDYGRARAKNPDPLPPLTRVHKCD